LSFLDILDFLDGIVVAFAGADTQRGFDRDNENLAVTNAPSLGRCSNGFNDAVGKAVFNDNLKLYLRQKVDDIFCASKMKRSSGSMSVSLIPRANGSI